MRRLWHGQRPWLVRRGLVPKSIVAVMLDVAGPQASRKHLFVGSDNYKFNAYRISDLRPTEREGFWAIFNRGQGVPSKANCRIVSGLGLRCERMAKAPRSVKRIRPAR
jgi:hypothetical protein